MQIKWIILKLKIAKLLEPYTETRVSDCFHINHSNAPFYYLRVTDSD